MDGKELRFRVQVLGRYFYCSLLWRVWSYYWFGELDVGILFIRMLGLIFDYKPSQTVYVQLKIMSSSYRN